MATLTVNLSQAITGATVTLGAVTRDDTGAAVTSFVPALTGPTVWTWTNAEADLTYHYAYVITADEQVFNETGASDGVPTGITPSACYYGTIYNWVPIVSKDAALVLLDPGGTYNANAANGSSDDAPNSANPYGFSNNQMAQWYSWGKKSDSDIDAASRGKTLIVPMVVGGVAMPSVDPANTTRDWYEERWGRRLTWLSYQSRIIASASTGASLSDGDKAIIKLVGDPIAEVTAAADGDVDPGADKAETPESVKANCAISTSVARPPNVPGVSGRYGCVVGR